MESMVCATWRGVTCACPRRLASVTACFTMVAASGVRPCCTAQLPVLMLEDDIRRVKAR